MEKWEIKKFDNGIFIKPVNNATYVATVNESRADAEENANLIAAVPALLEACKISEDTFRKLSKVNGLSDLSKKVLIENADLIALHIAKAEGKKA